MGYGKSKPGMFKMKYQGVPGLLKALTGGQEEMVSKMREQGKTSAADKIEKGILAQPEKAAAKKYGKQLLKKDPDAKNKRAKSSAELRRDAKGRVVGTSTERGGDIPLGTKKSTTKIASRKGKLFDEQGNVKLGKNKKFEDNLMTLRDGTVYGYTNTKGETVKIPQKDRFNVRSLRDASRVGGRLTGTGITNRTAKKAASEYYKYNMSIDNTNRASDRASKVVAAERAGDDVRYKKEDQNVKTAGAAPKKIAGVGTKSIKERIYEDGRKKKKNAPKRAATMTKKMYKR